MSEHAPLAPSAAHRWLACPGSHALCERTPADRKPPSDSVHSREGVFAHTIAARCLTEGIDAAACIGMTDGEFTCDADMATYLQEYLDAVRDVVFLEGGTPLVEQRVYFLSVVYGTADTILLAGKRLHVFDLKYGAGVYVPARDNEQLEIYALGSLIAHGEGVEEVVLHIVQPRHSASESHRVHTISAAELRTVGERIHRGADLALDGTGPLVSGDHCQFCPARLVCPQLSQDADEAAAAVFSTPAATAPAPETMTVETIARVLSLRAAVSTWIKSVEDFAERTLAAGGVIPGFTLLPTKGHRKWIDERAAVETLTMLGVHPYKEPAVVTPAQAEKLSKKLKPVIASLVQTPIAGYKVVPADTSVDVSAFLDG